MLYVFSLYGAKIQQICQKTKNLRLFVLYIIYYILNMYAREYFNEPFWYNLVFVPYPYFLF